MKEVEVEATQWIGFIITCQTIIQNTINLMIYQENKKRNWIANTEKYKKRGSIKNTKEIYAHALIMFLSKKSISVATEPNETHMNVLNKSVIIKPKNKMSNIMCSCNIVIIKLYVNKFYFI